MVPTLGGGALILCSGNWQPGSDDGATRDSLADYLMFSSCAPECCAWLIGSDSTLHGRHVDVDVTIVGLDALADATDRSARHSTRTTSRAWSLRSTGRGVTSSGKPTHRQA